MRGTVADFKNAYHSMSDDALLAIDPEELVEAARHCYDEELAARSLTPPDPQPAAEPAPPDELVCVAVFNLKREADLAQSLLESAEIPCFQPNEHMLDINPAFATALMGGCQVLVSSSDAEQARILLMPVMAEANKALVGRWFEDVWNGEREDRAKDFGAGADPVLRSRFSGLHVTVDELIAEGDKVAARVSLEGKRGGETIRFHGVAIVKVEGGRIVNTWAMNDAPASLTA